MGHDPFKQDREEKVDPAIWADWIPRLNAVPFTNGRFRDDVRRVVEEAGATLEGKGKTFEIVLKGGSKLGFYETDDGLLQPVDAPEEATQGIIVNISAIPNVTSKTRPERSTHRIFGNLVAKQFLTLVAGHGGIGKSSWSAAACYDIVVGGGRALGIPVSHIHQDTHRVLYVNLEDGQTFVDRAFRAVMDQHGDLHKNGLYAMGKDTLKRVLGSGKLQLLKVDGDTRGVFLNGPVWEALRSIIRELCIDVLWLDPMKDIYGGTVMTNEAMNVLYAAFSDLAVEMDIAVVACVHTRKPAGSARSDQDQHDVKHGSEAVDTARCVINMNAVPRTKKAEWGIELHRTIIKAAVTKTNIGRAENTYYELIAVNVTCRDENIENVGVPVTYRPPKLSEGDEQVVFDEIRREVAEGRVKAASNARKDDQMTTLQVLIEGALAKHGKPVARAKEILHRLIAQEWIAIVDGRHPGTRKTVKVAKVGPRGEAS